jgi:hypothetical protein
MPYSFSKGNVYFGLLTTGSSKTKNFPPNFVKTDSLTVSGKPQKIATYRLSVEQFIDLISSDIASSTTPFVTRQEVADFLKSELQNQITVLDPEKIHSSESNEFLFNKLTRKGEIFFVKSKSEIIDPTVIDNCVGARRDNVDFLISC